MGNYVGKVAALIASGLLVLSCGKTEKVEGIKGPKGDKGEQGDKGPQGDRPQPKIDDCTNPDNRDSDRCRDRTSDNDRNRNTPTNTSYPPIIILNTGSCSKAICPQNTMIVCSCIDGTWKTIGIDPAYANKIRIRNYGTCEDYYRRLEAKDCIFWPRQQPIPTPTVTVTVEPYPVPVPTYYPIPNPNQC